MKLYTKQGDGGSTGLFLGGRISKSDLRCEAYGLVDTAVSAMGLARAFSSNNNVKEIIKSVQLEMFTVGSELAVEKDSYEKFRSEFGIVTEKMISNLEEKFNKTDALKKLNNIDFHRQLRNELIMIPIPKNLESWYNQYSALNQGHYLNLAFERVNHSSEPIFVNLTLNFS